MYSVSVVPKMSPLLAVSQYRANVIKGDPFLTSKIKNKCGGKIFCEKFARAVLQIFAQPPIDTREEIAKLANKLPAKRMTLQKSAKSKQIISC